MVIMPVVVVLIATPLDRRVVAILCVCEKIMTLSKRDTLLIMMAMIF